VSETPAPEAGMVANDAATANSNGTSPVIVENIPQVVTPPRASPAPAPRPVPTLPPAAAPRDDAKRKALVDAVEVPASGDAAEDSYSYGFRLWQAKLYPESQAKLKEYIGKYPKHRRISFARNLLGRSYLDEGKPALASVAFYENYTKNPDGERASESLYYLGVALTRLKKLPDACKVYDEFDDVYGKSASADLKSRVTKARLDAKCS
jgi:TolA-binding protein